MTPSPEGPLRLFGRRSQRETARIASILRAEAVGGVLLLCAAVIALIWANSPWSSTYFALADLRVGPSQLHLDLSLATWAADGLLAIFFFVVGLELKREFVAGDLRDPRRAVVPVTAAFGGVVVPAMIYLAVAGGTEGAGRGWAIPTATDIAFALAVLAVVGRHLPAGLRTFLLTLAVVDDLLAIAIIAIFFTADLHAEFLLLALIPLAAFTALVQWRVRRWWLLLPLALTTWVLFHESGVHATVAGVLLGFAVPVLDRGAGPDTTTSLAEHFEHRFRPLSAGLAVPLFAFFATGVAVGGFDGLLTAWKDPIAVGIVLALVLGKTFGITAATWLVARFTGATLDADLSWWDVLSLAVLSGMGFTVSLLLGELAFGAGSERDATAKVAVLTGSLLAALLASGLLRARARHHRKFSPPV